MGTPEFAVPTLSALLEGGYEVAGVITAPDKPAGRGMKLQQSAVKKFALEHALKILQPVNLKSPEFINELRALKADLQIVVAFRMLPEIVWNMPSRGTINLHASLLPQYRGAAPINHAIINGETKTGVTTFKLKHDIDTGNILLQKVVPISEKDTAGTVHDKLMSVGAGLVITTIERLLDGTLNELAQNEITAGSKLKSAPKLNREDGKIDWKKNTLDIYNLIRGLSPYPGAFTFLKDKRIIVTEAVADSVDSGLPPGAWQTDNKTFLNFATADGLIKILKLKPEGKREMHIEDFLRGYRDI